MQLEPQEQEVLNRLKAVVRTYGLYIGIGLVGGISVIVGWNLYQYFQLNKLEQASLLYQQFTQVDQEYNEVSSQIEVALLNQEQAEQEDAAGTALGDATALGDSTPIGESTALGDTAAAGAQPAAVNISELPTERAAYLRDNLFQLASLMRQNHPTASYTSFAVLRTAALQAIDGNTQGARDHLSWVFQNTKSAEIAQIAGSMLGRVLVSEAKYTEALALLNSNKMRKANSAIVSELRGDIFAQNGDYEEAAAAYRQALEQGGNSDLLNYKIYILPI